MIEYAREISKAKDLESLKRVLQQYIPQAYKDATATRYYVMSIERSMTADSGDVSYTGSGFTPSALVSNCYLAGLSHHSGMSDGTTNFCVGMYGSTHDKNTGYAVALVESGSKYQIASVKTFDADGVTLTWLKEGATAAGTGYITLILFR